jgi:DNA (cytosine-5)-methyltransferase 1
MAVYYNEIEPFAAEWMRNLIKKGLIADGEVDERSIVDVRPDELREFTQCHFFAGIGGWSHALRLAGWPDDRPIWTGSCPCQPFSVAGRGLGEADPRHLWPHFHRLIVTGRPPVVMGEQVAGAAGYGWLDGVRADLERENYACQGVDIPACAVDAPHIRQRLYWVARNMDDTNDAGLEGHPWDGFGGAGRARQARSVAETGSGDMADASVFPEREQDDDQCAIAREDARAGSGGGGGGHASSFWSNAIWLTGADGKARRAEPSIPLLAHGIPGRVGRLRAYGNAIVPPLAAEVIRAFMDVEAGELPPSNFPFQGE